MSTSSIDPLRRELRRGDPLLSLSPKVFDCIAYLISRRSCDPAAPSAETNLGETTR